MSACGVEKSSPAAYVIHQSGLVAREINGTYGTVGKLLRKVVGYIGYMDTPSQSTLLYPSVSNVSK